ncbi:MAG TPA: elongation factor G [Kofleriaceae bacterium]|nr:elongation factor G [Kofleriaceae bacterium]
MKVPSFRPADIRNIALIGRAGSGKTTLAEAVLHRCGAITRMGSVDAATTTSDFEPEAKSHHHSISAAMLFASCDGREINIIDTPGHPDFIGQALAALPAVETAVLVVDAAAGIDLPTRRLYGAAGELGLARMVVVNKIDQAPGKLAGVVEQLRTSLGPNLHCINLPSKGGTDVTDCFDHEAGQADFGSVAEVHQEMLESSVEIDDALLERYLGGEPIDLPSLRKCFIEAMAKGHVVPVLFTSATNEVGIDDLVHILNEEGPSPLLGRPKRLKRGDETIEVVCDANAPLIAHVWKIANDPYAGKLAMVRILQGTLDGNTPFVAASDRKPRKAGQILKIEGREHPEVEGGVAYAGDLIGLARIEELHVDQLLHAPGVAEDLAAITPRYPAPVLTMALETSNKNDDAKLGSALQRLCEEDPSLHAGQDRQIRDYVISGQGELHLKVALEKLKNRFGVSVSTRAPRISYRETITAPAEGHYRLKKQTGGAGQFAEVFLRVEPRGRGEGFECVNDVFGGAIPHQFIGSVERGIADALEVGALSGSPVQDVRVVITDGKAHSVDSKDIAFRTAGKLAARDAFSRARPVLLEPIVNLEITVPETYTGTVTGDLKNMRGRVLGFDTLPGGVTLIHAQAPLAEVGNYVGQLRGATAGQGSFAMELSHYDVAPQTVQAKVTAAYKPHPVEE